MNEIAVVTEQDIPDILRMIHEIYSELLNKEWFSLDSDEEVQEQKSACNLCRRSANFLHVTAPLIQKSFSPVHR